MLFKSSLLVIAGLSSGFGVAAGTFAFFVVIRVIPRLVQKAKLEHKVICIETTVFRGVMFGTVLSIFSWKKKWLLDLLGKAFLTIFGATAGIFTGCIAVALAEILDTFPIFFRRLKLDAKDTDLLLLMMALGKMIGSLFYFFMGYDTINP